MNEKLVIVTLKSCIATTANMNCNKYVTIKIWPIILIATRTDLTTCWEGKTRAINLIIFH
jgi:hypothetical protein